MIRHKTLVIETVAALLLAPNVLVCQDKLASLSFGRSFQPDSMAYQFSFAFNRTEAADPANGPTLVTWRFPFGDSTGIIALTPAAEANIGSGVGTAPNNIRFDVLLRYSHSPRRLPSHSALLVHLGPSMTADKNFATRVYSGVFGGTYLYYNNPNFPRVLVSPGFDIQPGIRSTDSLKSHKLLRLVPSLACTVAWKSGLTVNLLAEGFQVWNDTPLISDGFYTYLTLTIDYRIFKRTTKPRSQYGEPQYYPLGLSVTYTTGRELPRYDHLNALLVGVALYR